MGRSKQQQAHPEHKADYATHDMTVCDLVHCAYSKNFNLVNDDKRPMLRTLHQRRLWKRLQKAFADTNDDESLAMSRVLPEAFRNYQGATAQKEQVAEHESQQQQQQQQQEQEQEQEQEEEEQQQQQPGRRGRGRRASSRRRRAERRQPAPCSRHAARATRASSG